MNLSLLTDLLARTVVVGLFGGLCLNFWGEFQRTGHITGLLLVISEALVVALTLVRRSTPLVDRSAPAALVTLLSVFGPTLLRPGGDIPALAPDVVTGTVVALALGLVVTGKCALGRSFGLVPANRGVVIAGPYSLVRHPIYTGYLVSHIALLCAHPSTWNAVLLAVADGALIIRALLEERVLLADERYQAYCKQVGWHLVPGVF